MKYQLAEVLGFLCHTTDTTTVKWSCFSGQVCSLAKIYLVSVHAAFRVCCCVKYAMSGVRLSRAV
jgi:hypothetical protein